VDVSRCFVYRSGCFAAEKHRQLGGHDGQVLTFNPSKKVYEVLASWRILL
jgi:hypothetical protein